MKKDSRHLIEDSATDREEKCIFHKIRYVIFLGPAVVL